MDLIGTEQNYSVKGKSIQNNLHFVRQILEGLEDYAEVTLINLDQSKAFDRVDHRFLAVVFETAGFEPEFRKWITMLYRSPTAVEHGNWKLLESFVIER